jgi:hypothetical protein
MDRTPTKYVYLILLSLTFLFAIRVAAQLVEFVSPGLPLPDFNRWYSGAIAYSILLPLQLLILSAMICGTCCLGRLRLNQGLLKTLRAFSILYFIIMLIRLLVSLSDVNSLPWFQLPLPAFFHLVLASYLFCITRYLLNQQDISGELSCTR